MKGDKVPECDTCKFFGRHPKINRELGYCRRLPHFVKEDGVVLTGNNNVYHERWGCVQYEKNNRASLLTGLIVSVLLVGMAFSGCVSLSTARRRQEKSFKVGFSGGKLAGYTKGVADTMKKCVAVQKRKYWEALEMIKKEAYDKLLQESVEKTDWELRDKIRKLIRPGKP